jgi:hypothetical protein
LTGESFSSSEVASECDGPMHKSPCTVFGFGSCGELAALVLHAKRRTRKDHCSRKENSKDKKPPNMYQSQIY